MKKEFKVGIIGMGDLGQATARDFVDNYEALKKKIGPDMDLSIKSVCDLDIDSLDLAFLPPQIARVSDYHQLLNDPEIQIVIESVGTFNDADRLVEEILKSGKCAVTTNKDLLAKKGAIFFDLAAEHGVGLGIEGALLGGVPIISVIKEGLIGDRINSFYGIVNGVSNFILTGMEDGAENFDQLLQEAERLKYTEKDHELDVGGIDAAEKANILARLCFGKQVNFEDVYYEGITRIRKEDFDFADKLGYTIRHVAFGEIDSEEHLSVSATPTLIAKENLLALVKSNHNGLFLNGNKSGETFYYTEVGRNKETGIGIWSDVVRLARALKSGTLSYLDFLGKKGAEPAIIKPYDEMKFPFYLRFRVDDQPGVLAAIDEILAWYKINIRSVLNVRDNLHDSKTGEISFVIDVDEARVKDIKEAVREMQGLKFFKEEPFVVRIMRK